QPEDRDDNGSRSDHYDERLTDRPAPNRGLGRPLDDRLCTTLGRSFGLGVVFHGTSCCWLSSCFRRSDALDARPLRLHVYGPSSIGVPRRAGGPWTSGSAGSSAG